MADNGLICPKCGCADLRVRRTVKQERKIKRYRQCRNCGRTVTTFENSISRTIPSKSPPNS